MKKIKLGDACEILNGFAFKSENYVGSGIRVIRISNVQKGYIEDNTPAFYPLETKGLEKYMLEEGDLLISLTGNVGRVAILEKEFMPAALNQRVACLRLKTDKLSKRYLFHILNSDFFEKQCIQYSKGVAQKNMSTAWLKDYEILLYSKEQQELIADILDKMHLIKKSRYYQLQKLDELVKARFVEMFGDPMINPYEWKVINISEVLRAKASNGFFSRRDDYCDDGNVKVLGVANVVNRMYSQVVDLPRTNANERDIEKFEVKYGDMLFCRSSLVAEGIGKASIIPEGVQTNILFECHVIRLPLDLDKCVPEFLQTLSTTKFFRNQIISKSKTATMTTIGQDGILKTNIILPPLEKQKEYYNFVKQIDKSRSRIQKSLEASQELFDSLMQEYFG